MAVWADAMIFHDLLERLAFEPAFLGGMGDVPLCLLQNMVKIGNGKLLQNLMFGRVVGH